MRVNAYSSQLKQSTNKGNYFSLSFQSWENNLIISNLGTSLARIDGVVPRGVPNYIQTTREILIIIFNCLDYLETWNSKRNRIFNKISDKRLPVILYSRYNGEFPALLVITEYKIQSKSQQKFAILKSNLTFSLQILSRHHLSVHKWEEKGIKK